MAGALPGEKCGLFDTVFLAAKNCRLISQHRQIINLPRGDGIGLHDRQNKTTKINQMAAVSLDFAEGTIL